METFEARKVRIEKELAKAQAEIDARNKEFDIAVNADKILNEIRKNNCYEQCLSRLEFAKERALQALDDIDRMARKHYNATKELLQKRAYLAKRADAEFAIHIWCLQQKGLLLAIRNQQFYNLQSYIITLDSARESLRNADFFRKVLENYAVEVFGLDMENKNDFWNFKSYTKELDRIF